VLDVHTSLVITFGCHIETATSWLSVAVHGCPAVLCMLCCAARHSLAAHLPVGAQLCSRSGCPTQQGSQVLSLEGCRAHKWVLQPALVAVTALQFLLCSC
jgi:hypothetical protein